MSELRSARCPGFALAMGCAAASGAAVLSLAQLYPAGGVAQSRDRHERHEFFVLFVAEDRLRRSRHRVNFGTATGAPPRRTDSSDSGTIALHVTAS